MTVSAIIKKIFSKACVYFTVITALYALIVMIIRVDDNGVYLEAGRTLLFFVASLLFAVANIILTLKLNGPLKVFLHYLFYLFTFCTCFMLPLSPESSTMIVGIVLFTILYAVALTLILVVRSRYKVRTEKEQEYKMQYKK